MGLLMRPDFLITRLQFANFPLLGLLLLLFLFRLLPGLLLFFLLAALTLLTCYRLLRLGFLTIGIIQRNIRATIRSTTLPIICRQRPLSGTFFQLLYRLNRLTPLHITPRLLRGRIRGVNADVGVIGGDLHDNQTRISIILPSISSAVRKLRTLA